jgi:hypothetical protein
LPNRSWVSKVFSLSTIFALEAEVEAVDTGWRGLELLNGGDFFGGGAMIFAFRRGLDVGFCPISRLPGDLTIAGDGECLSGLTGICCIGFGKELRPLGVMTFGVL